MASHRGSRHLKPLSGFTLMELLVALLIVAILAGLIVPVLAGARDRGRTAACANNLRQLHTAFSLYSADHEGLLPPYHNWINALTRDGHPLPDQGAVLVRVLDPYTRSTRIWFCPSDVFAGTGVVTTDETAITIRGYLDHRYSSYRTSALFHLWVGSIPGNRGISAVTLDSEGELLTDNLWCEQCHPLSVRGPYSHHNAHHYLFFDGHLKLVRPASVPLPILRPNRTLPIGTGA